MVGLETFLAIAGPCIFLAMGDQQVFFTWGQLGLLAIWATYTLGNLSFG